MAKSLKKKSKSTIVKKVTIRLTAKQAKLLEKRTKGKFATATFTFARKKARPPYTVSCNLVRIAASARRK